MTMTADEIDLHRRAEELACHTVLTFPQALNILRRCPDRPVLNAVMHAAVKSAADSKEVYGLIIQGLCALGY